MAWIIKDNRKKYKVECDTCHSIIGFTKKDIIVETDEYYSSSSIRCPACHSRIVFSVDGIKRSNYEEM